MEVDWIYSSERSQSHRKPGSKLEFSRTAEEKRPRMTWNSGRESQKNRQNMEGS
jgi:hypothetical protein